MTSPAGPAPTGPTTRAAALAAGQAPGPALGGRSASAPRPPRPDGAPQPPQDRQAEGAEDHQDRFEDARGQDNEAPVEELLHRFGQQRLDGPSPPASLARDTLRALDIPKPSTYDGNGSFHALDQFLFATEMYLKIGNIIKPELQICIASGFLGGPALTWFQATMQSPDPCDHLVTWQQFRQGLFDNFAPANLVLNARNQLADCSQTSTVREYLTRFRNLVIIIKDVGKTELFDRFTRGLKPYIRKELILREVDNFNDAVRLAEKIETANQTTQPTGHSSSQPKPMTKVIRVNATTTGRTKLTDAQRDDCTRRGACFYCREEGHMVKDCPNRKNLQATMEPGNADGQ